MITPRRQYTLALAGGRSIALGGRTLVMGILNVTPDSFAERQPLASVAEAVERGVRLVEEGADLLDIGGESTRPGAAPVPAEEECRRVLPVIRALAGRTAVPLSIDTTKASVAEAALSEGAVLVNDVSGLQYDPALGEVVARSGAGLVLMHMRGRPRDMYADAVYDDVLASVAAELHEALGRARRAGIEDDHLMLDPGLGFAKRAEHSWRLLAGVGHPALAALDRPWLIGASRKSFLRAALGDIPPLERDWGTAASISAAILGGAHMVRVHAVASMVQVARVVDMIRDATWSAQAPPGSRPQVPGP